MRRRPRSANINHKAMNEVERKLFEGVLSKTLKMDGEATSSLFNEEGDLISIDPILEADKERVKNLREINQKEFDKGAAKAMERFEKTVKDQYEIDDDELKGVDLISAIMDKQKSLSKDAAKKVDIESHPDFIKFRQDQEKKFRELEKTYKDQIEAKDNEYQKEAIFKEIWEMAEAKLESMNPVLPDEPDKRSEWKKIFKDKLKDGREFQKNDKGFVVLKDGKPAEDDHGNLENLETLITNTASRLFQFKKAEDRSSAGNGESQTRRKYTFANRAEYNAALKTAQNKDEVNAMIEDYKAQHPS